MSAGAWHPDPMGRFAQRYYDGQAWTEHVVDAAGNQHRDPLTPAATPTAATTSPGPASAGGSTPGQPSPALIMSGAGLLAVVVATFALAWVSFTVSFGPERESESFDRSEVAEAVNDDIPSELRGMGLGSSSLPEANVPTTLYFTFGWILALVAAAVSVGTHFAPQLKMAVAAACGVAAVWHLVALLGAVSFIDSVLGGFARGSGMGGMLNLDVSIAIGGWLMLAGLVLAAVGAALSKPAA